MTTELVMPPDALRERLGLRKPSLVKANEQMSVRKVKHVHPATGAEAYYLNARDLLALMDREYELTESEPVAGLARVVRQMVGLA